MAPDRFSVSQSNRPVIGALYVLGASFLFALMGAAIKEASAGISNTMMVFLRNALALMVLLPWLLTSRYRSSLRTRHPGRHLIRCTAGLGAMYLFFYAISHMSLAEAVLLSFTSPLFIPLVARIWIGEPLSLRIFGAVLLGFAGVLLILRPGTGLFRPVALIGLSSGLLVAVAMVSIRYMSDTEPPGRIVFYFTLLSTGFSTLGLPWAGHLPQPATFGFMVLAAGLAIVGQLLMTRGYSLAPAARVGPFSYGNLILSSVLGWLLWGEIIEGTAWIGALLICTAGIIATLSDHRRPALVRHGTPGGIHALGRKGQKISHRPKLAKPKPN